MRNLINCNTQPVLLTSLCLLLSFGACAQNEAFHAGTAIPEFGLIATVDSDMPLDKQTKFKIVFDAAKQAEEGRMNRTLNSVARFINMHVEAGVPREHIDVAVVFHGPAAFDLEKDSSSAVPLHTLIDQGIQIYLCGQTAAARNVKKSQIVPGVKVALSAMTAHAVLQQAGYTLNPF